MKMKSIVKYVGLASVAAGTLLAAPAARAEALTTTDQAARVAWASQPVRGKAATTIDVVVTNTDVARAMAGENLPADSPSVTRVAQTPFSTDDARAEPDVNVHGVG